MHYVFWEYYYGCKQEFMPKHTELFDLVKSLTKSEKRYFRLYTSLHTKGGVNKYVQLFDLIDRQKTYDEAALRRDCAGDIGISHFAEAKHYLYNSILKALHLYHLEQSVDSRIQMCIHQAEILYDKKLYEQFERMLSRALELAGHYSRGIYVLDILSLQYRTAVLEQGAPGVAERVENLFGEMTAVSIRLLNNVQYWQLQARFFFLNKSIGSPRSQEDYDRYQAIMSHELLQDESRALSPIARVYFYLTHSVYNEMVHNFDRAFYCQKKMLEIVEQTPAFSEPAFKAYIPALYNLCLFSSKAERYEEFFRWYPRLLAKTAEQRGVEGARTHIQALTLLPGIYTRAGEFDKALAALQDVEQAMAGFRGKHRVGMRILVDWMGFTVHFGLGRYNRCLDYLNIILDRRNPELSRDIHYAARLAFLIVHFELRNFDLLEYLLKSTYKYFLSQKRNNRFETAVLACIRDVLKSPAGDVGEHFRTLYGQIVPLQDDPLENAPFAHFDYIAWIRSKLEHRPFADIIREKKDAPRGAPLCP